MEALELEPHYLNLERADVLQEGALTLYLALLFVCKLGFV